MIFKMIFKILKKKSKFYKKMMVVQYFKILVGVLHLFFFSYKIVFPLNEEISVKKYLSKFIKNTLLIAKFLNDIYFFLLLI